jgi:hypothetical protein
VASNSFVKGPGVRPLDPDDHFLFDTAQGLLMFDPDGSGAAGSVGLARIFGPSVDGMMGSDLYIGV